ncbi:hypothetical protein [Candidatus Pantoea soli]|uniref:hypothetical protein n=1 Tax=Candidatus Pantoea soli TaxID=3098669 RepID=UPI0021BDD423|nr:hypothetical protein [Pantoea soli]
MSQNPIGLRGGTNLYAYAPNPFNWIDLLGLSKCSADKTPKTRNSARKQLRSRGINKQITL